MKWRAQERDPKGLRRVVRNGQVPGWRGAGMLEVQGPPVNDRRVDEHEKAVPVHEPASCRCTCVPRQSRRCCWRGICAGCGRGTSARRSRRCSGRMLWDCRRRTSGG